MSATRQLEMRLVDLAGFRLPNPAPEVILRTFRTGDEADWARIMNECIGEGWTAERCLNELVAHPGFRADGCFIAELEGRPEGTATALVRPDFDERTGYLHMVGVTTAARGRGLGTLVTAAALHWLASRGFEEVVLHTDDWRLPAIDIYLKLGFRPVIFDQEHAQRWDEVGARLADREGSQPPARGRESN